MYINEIISVEGISVTVMNLTRKNILLAVILLMLILHGHCVWNNEDFDVDQEDFNLEQTIRKAVTKKQFPDLFTNFDSNQDDRRVIPMYSTTPSKQCNCELKTQRIDLGIAYFPRYLLSGSCTPNSCDKHYRCLEKIYNILVLKWKTPDDAVKSTKKFSTIRVLQDSFMKEVIPVVVSCQCVVDVL